MDPLWRGFIGAGIIHRPRPRELKLAYVLPIDLIQRTVTPRAVGAPPVQPIAWRRIPQHRLGDRAKFSDLREEAKPSAKRHHGDGKCDSRSHTIALI